MFADGIHGDVDEEGKHVGGWGAAGGRKAFYDADTAETEDSDIEDDELEEAKRLQEAHAKELATDDYLTGFAEEPTLEARVGGSKGSKGLGRSERLSGQGSGGSQGSRAQLLATKASSIQVEMVPKDLSVLSREEKLEIVMSQSPELLGLLEEFRGYASTLVSEVRPVRERLVAGDMATKGGMSYFEVKFHLLLSYCINVSFYLLLKTEGKPVQDHPVIEQLVYIRVLLEKLRPLDAKLKYHTDKLLKMATAAMQDSGSSKGAGASSSSGAVDAVDPLAFQPSLADLGDEDDDQNTKRSDTTEADEEMYRVRCRHGGIAWVRLGPKCTVNRISGIMWSYNTALCPAMLPIPEYP